MTVDSIVGFAPLYSADAKILILGSMPGKASLAASRYYAHPRNAFWHIMSDLLGFTPELAYDLRIRELRRHGIALWDVVHSCQRRSSLDSDIILGSVQANDFGWLLSECPGIQRVCLNGKAAGELYRRRVVSQVAAAREIPSVVLPSTSPAYASLGLSEKTFLWHQALLSII
jgi:TDG/mug DNA glycosylase family protein